MPDSESTLLIIEPNSCHTRQTKNWILCRFWRDLSNRLDDLVKNEQQHGTTSVSSRDFRHVPPPAGGEKDGVHKQARGPSFEALRVTVFEFKDETSIDKQGVPVVDWVWLMGILVIVVQLGIASITWGTTGEWDIFLVTAAGNLFAITSGSLPQWRMEKWACSKSGGQTVAITEGNGSRNVVVILKKPGVGLDLEVLARGTRTAPTSKFTRLANIVLAVLWILLLITVQAIKQNAWCELLILSRVLQSSAISALNDVDTC